MSESYRLHQAAYLMVDENPPSDELLPQGQYSESAKRVFGLGPAHALLKSQFYGVKFKGEKRVLPEDKKPFDGVSHIWIPDFCRLIPKPVPMTVNLFLRKFLRLFETKDEEIAVISYNLFNRPTSKDLEFTRLNNCALVLSHIKKFVTDYPEAHLEPNLFYLIELKNEELLTIALKMDLKPKFLENIPQLKEKTEDIKALQAWIKSFGKNPPGVKELVRQAQAIKKPAWGYFADKVLERKIRKLHPNYTPGKPGRKKSK
jgi:hypothetical protein